MGARCVHILPSLQSVRNLVSKRGDKKIVRNKTTNIFPMPVPTTTVSRKLTKLASCHSLRIISLTIPKCSLNWWVIPPNAIVSWMLNFHHRGDTLLTVDGCCRLASRDSNNSAALLGVKADLKESIIWARHDSRVLANRYFARDKVKRQKRTFSNDTRRHNLQARRTSLRQIGNMGVSDSGWNFTLGLHSFD
jgi:hypothetical protein